MVFPLPHNSGAQSGSGKSITSSQMRPGDLVFYSGSGGINHVALYIGNGQVCHASNAKSGIKISHMELSYTCEDRERIRRLKVIRSKI